MYPLNHCVPGTVSGDILGGISRQGNLDGSNCTTASSGRYMRYRMKRHKDNSVTIDTSDIMSTALMNIISFRNKKTDVPSDWHLLDYCPATESDRLTIASWVEHPVHSLLFVGPNGTCKSLLVRKCIHDNGIPSDRYIYISTFDDEHAKTLMLYCMRFPQRYKFVVIDAYVTPHASKFVKACKEFKVPMLFVQTENEVKKTIVRRFRPTRANTTVTIGKVGDGAMRNYFGSIAPAHHVDALVSSSNGDLRYASMVAEGYEMSVKLPGFSIERFRISVEKDEFLHNTELISRISDQSVSLCDKMDLIETNPLFVQKHYRDNYLKAPNRLTIEQVSSIADSISTGDIMQTNTYDTFYESLTFTTLGPSSTEVSCPPHPPHRPCPSSCPFSCPPSCLYCRQ